jgi:hypothetical protein
MADIEDRLRGVMHAAVDGAEASPRDLVRLVMRRRRRRQILLTGVAVLALLAAAVPTAIAIGHAGEPGPLTTRHHTPRARSFPTKMTGVPMPADTNLKFLIQTSNVQGLAVYSTATLRSQQIKGLPPPNEGYSYGRAEGGWWASPSVRIRSYCKTYMCAGPPAQYYFIADGSLTATRIGAGIVDNGATASDHAGAVWLLSYARASDNMATTSASARLVGPAGQPLGPAYRLPAGYQIVRSVGSYLLLSKLANINPSKPPAHATGPAADVLWDLRTARVARSVPNVIAAGPEQIAWVPACAGEHGSDPGYGRCAVQLLNVSTGRTVATPIRGFSTWSYDGTFSDDGSLLAVQLPAGATPNPQGPTRLAVLDTATNALTVIRGTTLSFADWQVFEWEAGSHRLIVSAGPGADYRNNAYAGPVQVAYWQPGDARLRLTTARNGSEISAVQQVSP